MHHTLRIGSARANKLRSLTWIGLLLAIIGSFFITTPAYAAECTAVETTACVQGMIKLSTGEPAEGVELSITGNGEDQTTATGADGRWAFTVEAAGTYTVTANAATLPEGQYFKSVDTREVTVQLHNSAGALFPLADTPPAETPTDGNGAVAKPDNSGSSSASSFSWPRFWQQFVSGIRMGLLIALASIGLSLVYGTTGVSNFSQGELVSFGGLIAAVMMTLTGNLWLAAIITVVIAGGFGWVQDKILWRPLRKRKLSLMQLMIVSIGLSIMMQYTFQFFFGSGVVRIDTATPATITIAGVTLTLQSYLAMGISIIAIFAVSLGLVYTRFGRATRAIADNPALAEASGIDVDRVVSVVWVIGTALAGLSGVFFGLVFNGITWFSGGQMLLLFFAAITLGGLGTAFGAIVGSMVIGMMVELTNIWLPGDLKYATALFVLIVILLVRPQGIFGRKERIG